MVNEREKSLIEEKMRQLGTKNMGAYIRKMAIVLFSKLFALNFIIISQNKRRYRIKYSAA